tara:strand:+ start:11254 stop:11475 length:222 start_codon:yes stop_codon:yes gene_type:complete
MKNFKKQLSEKLSDIGYHVNEMIDSACNEGQVSVYKEGKHICNINYYGGKFQKPVSSHLSKDIVEIIDEYGCS